MPTPTPSHTATHTSALARFSVMQAACAIADVPIEPPTDPCSAVHAELSLPQHQTSRWLLTFLPAMRALAAHDGAHEPSAPADWCAREPRLEFRSGSLWDEAILQETWASRFAGMRGHCTSTGIAAAGWVAQWESHEAGALQYFEALESRNAALSRAAEMLLAMLMATDGPVAYGRDPRTREFAEIQRAVFADPKSQWGVNAGARMYEHQIAFDGRLRTPGGDIADVTFAANDIQGLRKPTRSAGTVKWDAPLRSGTLIAAKAALRALYPRGIPPGLRAAVRDERVQAHMRLSGIEPAKARTIRYAIAAVEKEGWSSG